MSWVEIIGYTSICYFGIGAGISTCCFYDDYKTERNIHWPSKLFGFSVITVGWLPFLAETFIRDIMRGFN